MALVVSTTIISGFAIFVNSFSVLLGALLGTKVVPVPLEAVRKALVAHVPAKLAAANFEALDIEYGIAIQESIPFNSRR